MSMHMQPSDLSVTSRERRLGAGSQNMCAITPSVYVPMVRLGRDAPAWVARRRVAEARLLSLPHRLRNDEDFELSGESALVALGLDTWWSNPDVLVRRQKPSKQSLVFGGVSLLNTRVGPVAFRQRTASSGGPFGGMASVVSLGEPVFAPRDCPLLPRPF